MSGRLLALLRRGTPDALVPLLVRARLRRALADPAALADARAQMELVIGARQPDADLDAVARRYLARMASRGELRWHPALIRGQRFEGLENLLAARDAGRGAVVIFLHHGQYDGAMASLPMVGVPCSIVAGADGLGPDAPDWLAQHMRVSGTGNTLLPAVKGVADQAAVILGEGGVVLLAPDVPGRTEVTFLGRRLLGSGGAAHLAMRTGSPLVPMTGHRDAAGRPFARIGVPLDPRDHASGAELLAAALRVLEPAVLEWPEAYDEPLQRWGRLDDR